MEHQNALKLQKKLLNPPHFDEPPLDMVLIMRLTLVRLVSQEKTMLY